MAMAAPRSALTSTLLRASVRRTSSRTVAARCPVTSVFRSNVTATRQAPVALSNFGLPSRAGVVAGARWFSAGNDAPDLRLWDFAEVKEQAISDKDNGVVIVDVREPNELDDTGKIPGAINIPMTTAARGAYTGSEEDFEDAHGFERPSKDATLMFYCKAGVRARTAAAVAKGAGWDKVAVYPGSWLDWDKQGGPVERLKKGKGN